MPHDTPLIATIVVGLCLAFLLGTLAQRLRLSPIVGYLLAGVLVGPFTPGFVADPELTTELAEIGVILLMFGVGLHFSIADLLSVRSIAVPGALAQILCATILGLGLALLFGWGIGAGLVFGLALSVASTVVLLRALQARHLVTSDLGRIAVGWLIVEDLVMVLALVTLPALAPLLKAADGTPVGLVSSTALLTAIGVTALKVVAFVALMLVVGRRLIPAVLHYTAHTGSRELFRLGVLAIALGVAFGAAKLFGVSFALGAFFAGMILSESALSQQAANESLPLRDAFAVLFFVSAGMLLDPASLIESWGPVLATLSIIVIGKSIAAFLIVRAFGYPKRTGLMISVSLAQIGEFSFILGSLGLSLGLLPMEGQRLILAGAILSIMLNPLLFAALDRYAPPSDHNSNDRAPAAESSPEVAAGPPGHTVLIGFGRVGGFIGAELVARGTPLLVIDDDEEKIVSLRGQGVEAIAENGVTALSRAKLKTAKQLIVALPDAFEAGQIIEQARSLRPDLPIIARAHSQSEETHLKACGATSVIEGSREIAEAILAAIMPPSV